MLDIYVSRSVDFDCNSLAATAIGAFVGAIFAFLLNAWYEHKKKISNQACEITSFVYDLNILLKFIMSLFVDIERMLENYNKGNEDARAILYHQPIYLDEVPHFIITKNPAIYENIIHLQRDANVIWNTMLEYNDACRQYIDNREELLFKMWYQILRIIPKIHTSMLSLNIYYKKNLNKKTLIKDYMVNIIRETTEFLTEFIKDKEGILYSKKTSFNKLTNKDYTEEEKGNLEFIYNDCIVAFYDNWLGRFGLKDHESLEYISKLVDVIIEMSEKRKNNNKEE